MEFPFSISLVTNLSLFILRLHPLSFSL